MRSLRSCRRWFAQAAWATPTRTLRSYGAAACRQPSGSAEESNGHTAAGTWAWCLCFMRSRFAGTRRGRRSYLRRRHGTRRDHLPPLATQKRVVGTREGFHLSQNAKYHFRAVGSMAEGRLAGPMEAEETLLHVGKMHICWSGRLNVTCFVVTPSASIRGR